MAPFQGVRIVLSALRQFERESMAGSRSESIMFDLARRCGMATCYRCKREIETCAEFSIGHKNGWQLTDDPVGNFFSLENIGFSHLQCNIEATTETRG